MCWAADIFIGKNSEKNQVFIIITIIPAYKSVMIAH